MKVKERYHSKPVDIWAAPRILRWHFYFSLKTINQAQWEIKTVLILPKDSHWERKSLSFSRESLMSGTEWQQQLSKNFCPFSLNGFPLDRQLFKDCTSGRKMQLLKNRTSNNIDICLVDSHESSIKAIWNAYPSLEQTFHWCIQVTSRDSKQQAKYSGLRNILTSAAFVYNLGIMYDAVSELYDLSKHLKERHNIARSLFWVSKQIQVFASMADNPGSFAEEAVSAFQNMLLKKFCALGEMS